MISLAKYNSRTGVQVNLFRINNSLQILNQRLFKCGGYSRNIRFDCLCNDWQIIKGGNVDNQGGDGKKKKDGAKASEEINFQNKAIQYG